MRTIFLSIPSEFTFTLTFQNYLSICGFSRQFFVFTYIFGGSIIFSLPTLTFSLILKGFNILDRKWSNIQSHRAKYQLNIFCAKFRTFFCITFLQILLKLFFFSQYEYFIFLVKNSNFCVLCSGKSEVRNRNHLPLANNRTFWSNSKGLTGQWKKGEETRKNGDY